jgi:hypothetical protein
MAFFQDLGKKISNVTQDAAKKTSELFEVSKLNSAINTEKAAITELQKKIGATVYSLYTAGEPIPEALAADVQGISARLQNIADLENKIAEVKAETEKAREEAAAPEKTPESPSPVAKPDAQARFCTSCGASLDTGVLFCGKCGAKND